MRKLFVLISVVVFAFMGQVDSMQVQAQSEKMGDEEILEIKQHQIYLDKPAISIDLLEYDKDQTPIKGTLSQDGMRIIMDTYTHRGRVKLSVTYADGKSEELTKSSCFIDPVIPL